MVTTKSAIHLQDEIENGLKVKEKILKQLLLKNIKSQYMMRFVSVKVKMPIQERN